MDKVPFKPTFFVPSKNKTEYRTLEGKYVAPVQPGTIKECQEFLNQYSGVSGTQVYGMERWIYQYLAENYPGTIEYDTDKIKLWSLDIETSSENGFPKPELAAEEILLITLKNFRTKQLITFGSRPYTEKRSDHKYVQCKNEQDLIDTFLAWWDSVNPEVITGWNVEGFDIPYICNRLLKQYGLNKMRQLSPWALVNENTKEINGNKILTFNIGGITVIDYLEIYKRFTYTTRESYRLDVIAEIELGQKKLDHSEFETFKDFYTNDWIKFVDYNLVDVDLVDMLEEKMKLIDLVMLMAYDAKVNFSDTFTQVRLWDVIIYNYLRDRNIVLPLLHSSQKDDQYAGAYVKEPKPGMYDWVVSYDLNSLYPSLIRLLNISPETLQQHKHPAADVEKMIAKKADLEILSTFEDSCVAANGAMYSRDRRGFMPELVIKMYEERVKYKKQMLAYKQKLVNIKSEMKRRGLNG